MNKIVVVTILMTLSVFPIIGQTKMLLSESSIRKIQKAYSGKDRILAYYRSYRRDSIRFDRALKRKLRNAVDSTSRHYRLFDRHAEKLDVINEIGSPDSLVAFDQVDSALLTARDLVSRQSVEVLEKNADKFLRDKLPEHAQFPPSPDAALLTPDLKAIPQSVRDIASEGYLPAGIPSIPDVKMPDENNLASDIIPDVDSPINILDVGALPTIPSTSTPSVSDLLAVPAVAAATGKVSRLLGRFRTLTAEGEKVRRASVQNVPFRERLMIACHVNPSSWKPFAIALNPQIGYRISRNIIGGAGAIFTVWMRDSLVSSRSAYATAKAGSAFLNVVITPSFFAIGEFHLVRNTPGDPEQSSRRFSSRYHVGAGRRFLVHPNLYCSVSALYDLTLHDEERSLRNRFTVRVGFSLSELALRNRKPTYHPDRMLNLTN